VQSCGQTNSQIPFYRPTSSRALKGNAEIALILCFNWHVCCPYQTSLPLPAFFIRSYKYFNDYFAISFPFDTVGWATGRASGPVNLCLVCWWWRFDWNCARLVNDKIPKSTWHKTRLFTIFHDNPAKPYKNVDILDFTGVKHEGGGGYNVCCGYFNCCYYRVTF